MPLKTQRKGFCEYFNNFYLEFNQKIKLCSLTLFTYKTLQQDDIQIDIS